MGRPLGSGNKLRFKDYLSKKEKERLVELAKKRAETDTTILKFILEQIFGKAAQPIGNETNEPFKLQVVRSNVTEEVMSSELINAVKETEEELNAEDGQEQ